MFNSLDMAPADPILGLTDAFKNDPNPKKINLSVGVYKDANGATPVLNTVKKAEAKLLEFEKTKAYVGIAGDDAFGKVVQEMIFGASHEVVTAKRAATAHTPGGTGALRVAADFVRQKLGEVTVWLSDPTWPNHPNVFTAAGLPIKTYPYYDAAQQGLKLDALFDALKAVPKGDVVLLHACCHNPTGIDPTSAQWKTIAAIAQEKGWLPLFDFAYQGFGDGLTEDAAGLREFLSPGQELLICSSFSKNFGLYNERVGSLTVVGDSQDAAQKAFSHIKSAIRANYSNPPAHGSYIVTTILGDPALRQEWEGELKHMRDRINGMRTVFVETLKKKGVKKDFSFLIPQRGMFSFSGLTKDQVETLKRDYAIYIVGSGRINVAGMTDANMDPLCEAIAKVLA
ncbi:MAG: aromatic amino acid aminotransferase [Candidatus Hydrogenedentota bacterium]